MREMHRRTFIKAVATIGIGPVVAEISLPLEERANIAVNEMTGQPAGNAQIREKIEASCETSTDPQHCIETFQFTTQEKLVSVLINPPLEEVAFRGIPAKTLALIDDKQDTMAPVLYGSGEKLLTRRELFAGLLTSVIFGYAHNRTQNGIDTSTIPASQMIFGGACWFLQRKFGIVANSIAHSWHNFRLLT